MDTITNISSPGMQKAIARFVDGNCDGKLQSGEYFALMREITDRAVTELLSERNSHSAKALDDLSKLSSQSVRHGFDNFSRHAAPLFIHGIETPSRKQFDDFSYELRSKGRDALTIYKDEGYLGRLRYSVESFFGEADIGYRLDDARRSVSLSERDPVAYPACGMGRGQIKR